MQSERAQMRNPSLDAAVAELNAVGVRDYVVARGGKHWQLRWTFNGQPRMLTVPCTASDWRSPHNTRSDIRRLLRLDGLLPETNGGLHPPATPPCWRQQIEELARRLNHVNLPEQLAAERADIVTALRRLVKSD
jgi:hypothetical protein